MRKIILCSLLAAMFTFCTACNVTITDTNGNEITNDNVGETTTDDELEPTEQMKNHEGVYKLDFVDLDSKKIYLPECFEKVPGTYFQVHSGSLNTSDKIYYWLTHEWFYTDIHDPSTYDVNDVENIMQEKFEKMMTEVFPVVAEKPKLTVVSKKKVDVKGFEFLRKTGYVKAAGLPDMYYTAYFGITDSGLCDDVPIEWLIFSQCDDENTKTEVQYIADTIANEFEVEKRDRTAVE